jgi:hypothetical protein
MAERLTAEELDFLKLACETIAITETTEQFETAKRLNGITVASQV